MSDKRQQILDITTILFSKHGYHAVGIDRIIAESGVAKMTMYWHFPSKTDLLIAVLRQRQQQCSVSLKAFVDVADVPLASVIVMLLDGATLAVQISGRQSAATDAWHAARDLLALYFEATV